MEEQDLCSCIAHSSKSVPKSTRDIIEGLITYYDHTFMDSVHSFRSAKKDYDDNAKKLFDTVRHACGCYTRAERKDIKSREKELKALMKDANKRNKVLGDRMDGLDNKLSGSK